MTRSRAVWAAKPPIVSWGEERGSPLKTFAAFAIFFALLGFGLRVLWSL